MTFPFGVTVTVVRDAPGGLDVYGDPITSTSSRTDIPGCGLDDRYSTEPVQRGRAGVVVGKTLYTPPGTDIRATDRIEILGQTYVVDGEAGEPVNPFTGWAPGITVAIRRAQG